MAMKKINFLGVEVQVIDQETIDQGMESGEEHLYIISRVVDVGPNAVMSRDLRRRRLRTICEGCREICWIDPKSVSELRGMNLTMLCTQCALTRIKTENEEGDSSTFYAAHEDGDPKS